MMKKITNHQLYYWSAFVPLVALLLGTYSELKNQEALIEHGQQVHNRQLQVTSMVHLKRMEEQRMRHMANVIHQNHDHQQEIGGLVLFYSNVIKEINNKHQK